MTRLSLTTSITVAAAALVAAPAAALDPSAPGLGAASAAGVTIHRGSGRLVPIFGGGHDDRRRHRGFDGAFYVGDRDYQGDTAWRPEGFNDWWHERPLRNEPRWLRSNNCERQYWTGGGWRC